MPIRQVRKRDGSLEAFDPVRITHAIHRAVFDAGVGDGRTAKRLTGRVVRALEKAFPAPRTPSVEDVQDAVEAALKRWNARVAAVYHDFRAKKAAARKVRTELGVAEKLTYNAMQVLESRYLLRDEGGQIIETPAQMFRRVARAVAAVEERYGGNARQAEEEFYRAMARLEFMPNSPTLFNAGAPLGLLSACFVLPVEDSLESIFKTVHDMVLIEQGGGGVGFSFSRLRPRGDAVRSSGGVASGPVSFMRVFDTATDVIKQGGKRRGALMGTLRVDHPDIVEFITAKERPGALANFNISVAATDGFMAAVEQDKEYELINPRTGRPVKRLRARDVWDLIVSYAWRTGDPGLVFIDRVNALNPTAHTGAIESTNPCGEQPLHPWESCNLGSISLPKMLKRVGRRWELDWDKLRATIRLAVRFLDNVIDANRWVIPEIERVTKANRRIGLGVMGFADALLELGIPYDSRAALKLGEKLMAFIEAEGHTASQELGEERGSFPNFKGSLWEKRGYRAMRNATVTTIAPTGTLSIIAGVSSGIEPLFAVSFVRKVLEGRRLLEVNPIFERIAKERGFYSIELMQAIARSGSVQRVKGVPADVRRLFKTALDIAPAWHVRAQAAFQKHTDNAVSKTINFPREAGVKDVRRAYELAWRLGCKGITIYRYGSKPEQVLYIGERAGVEGYAAAPPETAGWCASPLCPNP